MTPPVGYTQARGETGDAGQQEPHIVEIPNPALMKAKARDMLLLKAMKAQEQGDKDKADRFFAMHESLLKESTRILSQDADEIHVITNSALVPQKRPSAAGRSAESNGIKFQWGTSTMGVLPPIFTKI
ncbi:hypothetical protein PGT21_026255 [Puccinia graminis f. sp. tritici]|uniref:Uncharacterized protein n=1 Tax=Puccinia graminis f. sp. tritici TaxID=56615 RepID=A0A5B0PM40_PUCGR|nr:hypothetical protein PGT21_026255 [Puccinia graminis f. sp. tritici]